MSLADVVADQLRSPNGPLAPLAAMALNRRNQNVIARTIEALDLRSSHSVLDVGFGGGLSLALLAARTADRLVAGIDPSAEMVRRARRRYARHIVAGRMAVERASAEALPFPAATFDRVLSSQTVYFWDCVATGLAEIHRVLAPDGRLAMAMMPKAMQEYLGFTRRGYGVLSHHQLVDHLIDAGFTMVRRWPVGGPDPRWIVIAERG